MINNKLTIIILSYNTKRILSNCLKSIEKVKDEVPFEIIVVDNGSSDSSVEMVKKYSEKFANVAGKLSGRKEDGTVGEKSRSSQLRLVENKTNLGFAAGNNKAKDFCNGEYVLFLNSDTVIKQNTLYETVKYLEKHKNVAALTCKVALEDGSLDKDTRRAFITPWIGFSHLFLKLDRLFPKSKFFSKYWYGYIPEDEIHEVDAIQGAFFLTRLKILNQVNWFDEDYFLDGEDIDLCWKIKERGWKIIYYPLVSIVHLKGVTKGKNNHNIKKITLSDKLKYKMAGVNSMEIFIRKRLWNKYPLPTLLIVLIGVKLLKVVRFVKVILEI